MYPIEKYEFKVFEQKNSDGSKSSVVMAISTYAGKTVKGVAKCLATDAFDLELGKKLAAARCDLKVCLKRRARAANKKHEIAQTIEKLTEEYNSACEYYDDAIEEAFCSLSRLHKIEAEMI